MGDAITAAALMTGRVYFFFIPGTFYDATGECADHAAVAQKQFAYQHCNILKYDLFFVDR